MACFQEYPNIQSYCAINIDKGERSCIVTGVLIFWRGLGVCSPLIFLPSACLDWVCNSLNYHFRQGYKRFRKTLFFPFRIPYDKTKFLKALLAREFSESLWFAQAAFVCLFIIIIFFFILCFDRVKCGRKAETCGELLGAFRNALMETGPQSEVIRAEVGPLINR